MHLYALSVFVYVVLCCLYRSSPDSLKEKPLPISSHLRVMRATIILGLVLITIFFLTSDFKFFELNQDMMTSYALNNNLQDVPGWTARAFSHPFLHLNWVHLVSNLSGLLLASYYEREVGSRRFLAVLTIACIGSIPSVFIYPSETLFVGVSGGLFGLFAAFITDHPNLSLKEWLSAILFFMFLSFMFSIGSSTYESVGYRIDHIGHGLGALSAIIYCRLRPLKKPKSDF